MASSIGSAPGILIGFAVGEAAGAALEPAFEIPRQEAWDRNRNKVLDVGLLARLVAQGGVDLGEAQDEAHRQGYADDKFDRMIYAAQSVPGTAELLFLWRLGTITEDVWREGMVKLGQRPDFIDHVAKTLTVPVTAEQAAILIQRSVIPNQGQLPFDTVIPPGNVTRMPQVKLDAYASAAAYGVGNDQLDALTRIVGLPASPDLAARMTFRNIITRDDFTSAIAEGNTRQEWADVLFDGFRQILTAHEYTELELRGFSDRAARLLDTDKLGMSHDDSDKLYDVLGRAPALHTVVIGLARGGVYNGQSDNIPEEFLQAMQRSNIRPEWYSIVYAARYSYPSPFVIRSLATAGDLGSTAAVEQILLEIGWKPELAKEVAAKWVPVGTTIDKDVTSAETKLKTTAHRSYIAEEIDDATATAALEAAGVGAGSVPAVLALWGTERDLVRKQLSPAKIVKAVKDGAVNAATGLAWTTPDALAALVARGYSPTEAQDLLNIG